MKQQPPSVRADLLTMMGIFLLAELEDVFFAGRLYSQIQSMLPAHSLLDCELWYGSAMEASVVCNLMLAGRSSENALYLFPLLYVLIVKSPCSVGFCKAHGFQ